MFTLKGLHIVTYVLGSFSQDSNEVVLSNSMTFVCGFKS